MQGFVEAYRAILEHGGPAFRRIFLYLSSTELPSPCLVHCTAGKDRTGVFTALLLSLLGVPDKLIAEEYALTDIGLGPRKKEIIDRLCQHPAFQEEGGREKAERMATTRPESMLATLEMLRREWGSADEYVRGVCGLTQEEVERVRGHMLVVEGSEAAKAVRESGPAAAL